MQDFTISDVAADQYSFELDFSQYTIKNSAQEVVTSFTNGITNIKEITIAIKKWSKPNRRVRIDEIEFGVYKIYDKAELLPNFGEQHIDRITRKDVQNYLFGLVEKEKNRTAQKVKQLLGAIFSLAVEDYEFKNPMTKIKLPHYEVKKGTPLSKEEEKRLIEFCKTNSHLYGVSAILTLLYTGMRVGELPSMTMGKNR